MYKKIWLKDIRAELYTWKSLIWLMVVSIALSAACYLLLTDRELSLLDQSEMLWLITKIIISVASLVVVIDSASLLTSEFEQNTIENLLLTPLSLRDLIIGKMLTAMTLWLVVYAVSVPYMMVSSWGSKLLPSFLAYVALYGTLISLGFCALVFAISFLYRSMKNTLTSSLLVLFALSVPALFASKLKISAAAKIYGVINPMDSIFSSLDNVLVDYQPSILQNITYIIPVLVFCIFCFAFLWYAVVKFNRQGVIK